MRIEDASRSYVMVSGSHLQAEASQDKQHVHIRRTDGTPLLTHRIRADQRPSIHPIHAPDGNGVLTEDSPSHHPWQHGLYTGFNLVNGIGFWKELKEDGTFHPTLHDPPEVDGPTARWSLEATWTAPDRTSLIAERQGWTLTDGGATFDLELAWTLRALVDVEIGQYMAGGLFLRMPYAVETGGRAINSEGLVNGDAEKQRARWVAVSMPIADRDDWGGFVIMDHPQNPGFPVTWRVDNELGISPSRCIAESWSIPAGASEHYRFLLHAFCGPIDSGSIDDRWNVFAGNRARPVP
jgi:hypothetical protein